MVNVGATNENQDKADESLSENIATLRHRTLEWKPENILKEGLQKTLDPYTAQEKGMGSWQSKISIHGTSFVELLKPVWGCSKNPTKKGRDKQHPDFFTSIFMKTVMEEQETRSNRKREKGEKVTRNIVNESELVNQVIVEKRKLPEMREKQKW